MRDDHERERTRRGRRIDRDREPARRACRIGHREEVRVLGAMRLLLERLERNIRF